MRRKALIAVLVLSFVLFFEASKEDAQGAIGSAVVTIHAGTNPIDEFSSATIIDYGGGKRDITVKLPGRTQSYILSRPCGLMPGWSASIDGSNTVMAMSPDGLKYVYPQSSNYMLTVIKDINNANIVIFDYNSTAGLIDRQIDGFDPNLYIKYDYNDVTGFLERLTAFDDTHGGFREYTITYDSNGRAVSVSGSCTSCGGGGGFRYEYDSNGLVQYVKNVYDTIIYEYVYDSNDRITGKYLGESEDNNHIQECVYSDSNDGSFIVDTYDYIDASSYRLTREYKNSAGLVTKRIKYENMNESPDDPLGRSYVEHVVYFYDPNNAVTKEVLIPPLGNQADPDPNAISGIRKEYTYDPNTGRLLTEKWFDANDVNFTVVSYTYEYIMTSDGNDIFDARVLSSIDTRGAVTEYFYDGNSVDPKFKIMPQVSSGISGLQQLKYEYEYDNRNRITLEKLLDDSNNVIVATKYEYDSYGNLLKRYDDYGGSNEITEYEYNGFNEMVKTVLPSGVIQGWSYYDSGKVEYEVVYDPCDLNKAYSQTKYIYDDNSRVKKIAQADDPNVFPINSPEKWTWTEYEYDLQDNKTKVIEDLNGLRLETTYEYNNQGEAIKVTLPNGKWTRTWRDGRGLVEATEVGYGSTTLAITTFKYDEKDNLKCQTAPNGVRTEYEYDDFDRLIKVVKGL